MNGNNRIRQQVFQRKCPNCGAALTYAPEQGKLYCRHCKSYMDFEKSRDVTERDFADLLDLKKWDDGAVRYYRCSNCGANTVLPRSTLATSCPYCLSPAVLDETQTGQVRPDTIEPFEITDGQAKQFVAKWAKKRMFAPHKFKRGTNALSVKGVYTPAWTFDLVTASHYEGRLGRTRTRTVRRNGKSYTETYVQWFSVEGDVDNAFDDLFISGNNHMSVKNFEELDLTNKEKYVVYTDEYLAGYMADSYTVEPDVAYGRAVDKANSMIYRQIMNDYGADHDGGLEVDTTVLSRSFKYVMLPVYVVSSKYRGKVYNQYVSGVYSRKNDANVKVVGKAPVSPWKVLLTVLGCLGLIAGIIALILCCGGDWSLDFGEFYSISARELNLPNVIETYRPSPHFNTAQNLPFNTCQFAHTVIK